MAGPSALSVTSLLAGGRSERPPVALIHGAANSALVWSYWQQELAARGWPSHAIDLRGHGRSAPCDLSRTSMDDYADDVRSFVAQLARPPALIGWSMGGLVALQVAALGDAIVCVALAPSTPAQARDPSVELHAGEFGPEFYGITNLDPDAPQPAMPDLDREERAVALASLGPESRWARDDRKAGIVITAALPAADRHRHRGPHLAAREVRRPLAGGRLPRHRGRIALGSGAEPPRAGRDRAARGGVAGDWPAPNRVAADRNLSASGGGLPGARRAKGPCSYRVCSIPAGLKALQLLR